MADTIRPRADLVTLFADNVEGDISEQDLRDFLISVHLMSDLDRVITVAKAGGQYTTIQSAIDSISDAASNKIYTVLVYPGEYDEAITLKNYVDIVAIDPESTKILRRVSDNGVECHCYLKITIESAVVQGLYSSNVNSVITIDGNVSSSANVGAGCDNGTQTINGNVSSSVDVGAECNGNAQTINGNVSSSGDIGASCGDGAQTINGNVSSSAAVGTNCEGGIQTIKNGKVFSTLNTASGHGIQVAGGSSILQNVKIICTHADAKSIYAESAQNVRCMNVWANRDDDANITQLIADGFNFDANVQ